MFGGAYLRREICVSKSIGLASALSLGVLGAVNPGLYREL